MRWVVSGCTNAVWWYTLTQICTKRHTVFLCSSHLAFSPKALLKSRWCSHTTVLTLLLLERISVLFYQRLDFDMGNNLSITVHALTSLSIDEILLLRYVKWSTDFRGLLLMWRWIYFLKKHNNFLLSEIM